MQKFIISGWVDTRQSFGGLAILAKGEERILFNTKKGKIHIRYIF